MAKTRKKTSGTAARVVTTARANYKLHLMESPNYFGSISKLDVAKLPKVFAKMLSNKSYEDRGFYLTVEHCTLKAIEHSASRTLKVNPFIPSKFQNSRYTRTYKVNRNI